jgi:uncharacterized OB-fold protein
MNPKPIPEINAFNRPFFEGCAKGELRVRLCPRCSARFLFFYEWCPNCWSLEMGWEKVTGLGKVSHYCVVHQAPYAAFEDVAPYMLALIDLDEGVRMMSNIIDCEPDDVYIGLPVKVTFKKRGTVLLPMFVLRGS